MHHNLITEVPVPKLPHPRHHPIPLIQAGIYFTGEHLNPGEGGAQAMDGFRGSHQAQEQHTLLRYTLLKHHLQQHGSKGHSRIIKQQQRQE
jgi:hypothetical protein